MDNNSVVGKELLNKLLNLNKRAEKFKAGTYVLLSAKDAYVWQFLCKDLYATVEEVTYDEDSE